MKEKISKSSLPLKEYLEHMVLDAEKNDLNTADEIAFHGKTIQTLLGFNIGKDRLHNGKALRIYFAASLTVDFVLHRFGRIALFSADRERKSSMPISPQQIQTAENFQNAAAHDTRARVRLVAGPGTGKSFAIEERVC